MLGNWPLRDKKKKIDRETDAPVKSLDTRRRGRKRDRMDGQIKKKTFTETP